MFPVNPIKLRRTKAKFIMGTTIDISCYEIPDNAKTLFGLPSKLIAIPTVIVPQGLDMEGPFSDIIIPEKFPPGSIMVFETHLQELDNTLDTFCASGVQEAFHGLDLVDLNVVLYRTDGEERDVTDGEFGAYDVPGLGKAAYCGLEGWMCHLRHIMRYNDLGHPLCGHLRDGTWALDYVHTRLTR
jgi:glycogen debranching enzyme